MLDAILGRYLPVGRYVQYLVTKGRCKVSSIERNCSLKVCKPMEIEMKKKKTWALPQDEEVNVCSVAVNLLVMPATAPWLARGTTPCWICISEPIRFPSLPQQCHRLSTLRGMQINQCRSNGCLFFGGINDLTDTCILLSRWDTTSRGIISQGDEEGFTIPFPPRFTEHVFSNHGHKVKSNVGVAVHSAINWPRPPVSISCHPSEW